MKMLHVLWSGNLAGSLPDLAKYQLGKSDLSLEACFGRDLDGVHAQAAIQLGVTCHVLGMKKKYGVFSNLKGAWVLNRLIKKNQYDLVQFHEAIMPFLVPSVKVLNPRVKVIMHDHGDFVPFFESVRKSIAVVLKRIAYRLLLVPRVDKIVCVSQHVLDDNRSMFISPRKLHLIYNATKVDVLKQIESRRKENREKILKELNIPKDDFVVATAARMVGWKRIDYLLKAFAAVSMPNKSLILMGQGPKAEELKTLAEKLGIGRQAHFLGYRKDAKEILSGMDVVVLPSQGEAFGLTALEAIIMHVPVFVMHDGYGLTEFVKNGRNGFICQDLGDLSQKLNQFALKQVNLEEDPDYPELLERSRAEHYIGEFKKLYREMLGTTTHA